MSYYNDKFNTQVLFFEPGVKYNKDTFIKYNGHLYLALRDTDAIPTEKETDENWEYIGPNEYTNVIANIGCANTGYPISIGSVHSPFYAMYLLNSLNIVTKNKTNRPGLMGTLRFGAYMSDEGSAVDMNMMYDTDYQNPSLTAITERLDEVSLGTGQYRYRDLYLSSSPSILSDKDAVSDYKDLGDVYMEIFSKLKPVEYTLSSNHGYGSSNRTHIGFFGEDVEKIIEECGLSSDKFAGLIKVPIMKKDIYKDFEINYRAFGHYHFENGVEVPDTEIDYKKYLTGENIIRYCNLPIYSKELGFIYIKNYPLGVENISNEELGPKLDKASDMDIIIKSLELIPYDDSDEIYKLNLSDLVIEDAVYPDGSASHHEILENGYLKISFEENSLYVFTRISIKPDRTDMDCSKYKYLRVVSDYKQQYLIGFSDVKSADDMKKYPDYKTSEFGDMYSYAQDDQYEIVDYIYSLRYEEFIALITKKVQDQEKEIDDLKNRISALEELINK